MKRMKMILIVVLVAILTLGCLESKNTSSQPSTEAGITPAESSTESSSDSGGLFSAIAGASTVPLTTDTGQVIDVEITVTNAYKDKTFPTNIVEITNLRYNSAKQEITGEAKSTLTKKLATTINAYATDKYADSIGVIMPEKSAPYGKRFVLQAVEKNVLSDIKLNIAVPNNYLS